MAAIIHYGYRSQIWASFFILLLLCEPAIGHISEQEIPFLYYYSENDSAFVIESADGGNKRVLISYTLPSQDNIIIGPGWSASGNWFAWATGVRAGLSSGLESQAFIVSKTGAELENAIVGGQIVDLSWSPVHDILLVRRLNELGSGTEYLLLDVQNNLAAPPSEITKLDVPSDAEAFVEWTPTGLLAMYHSNNLTSQRNDYVMRVFSNKGQQIGSYTFLGIAEKPIECFSLHWSDTGLFAYIDSNGQYLHIQNSISGDAFIFDAPIQQFGWADWSPDNTKLIVYSGSTCTLGSSVASPMWLLSLTEKTIEQVSERAIRPARIIDNFIRFISSSAWSPDGTKIAFREQQRGWILDVESLDKYEISAGVMDLVVESNLLDWSQSENRLTFIAKTIETSPAIYTHDVASKDYEILSVTHDVYPLTFFAYSENEKYIAYTSFECGGACVLDREQETAYRIVLSSDISNEGNNAFEIMWHPRANWMILTTDAVGISRVIYASDASGNMVRKLGECSVTPSCFGWLPDVAN
ncbi:hypothetical protein VZO05_13030 [Aggregatilineales bacterium SYSU G02658]